MAAFWWEAKTPNELSEILGITPRRARALVESLVDRGIGVIVHGEEGKRAVTGFTTARQQQMDFEHAAARRRYEAMGARTLRCPHCEGLFVPLEPEKVETAR